MESNLPVMSKRVWNMVRVVYLMLRKGISKGKLMMDLNMMLKRRGKLAGKAIANLISFHHHGSSRRSNDYSHTQFSASNREYEFSCSNTPNYTFLGKRNRHHHHNSNNFFTCAHAPPTRDDEVMTVKAVLEMLNNNETSQGAVVVGASPSPAALPGFGKSPMVRQLRVTDSPFPLREDEDNNNSNNNEEVDKAAEDFINRFYSQLRRQD